MSTYFIDLFMVDATHLCDSMYNCGVFGTSVVDIEAVAALPFKEKTKWFLSRAQEVIAPPRQGHILLST